MERRTMVSDPGCNISRAPASERHNSSHTRRNAFLPSLLRVWRNTKARVKGSASLPSVTPSTKANSAVLAQTAEGADTPDMQMGYSQMDVDEGEMMQERSHDNI